MVSLLKIRSKKGLNSGKPGEQPATTSNANQNNFSSIYHLQQQKACNFFASSSNHLRNLNLFTLVKGLKVSQFVNWMIMRKLRSHVRSHPSSRFCLLCHHRMIFYQTDAKKCIINFWETLNISTEHPYEIVWHCKNPLKLAEQVMYYSN